MISMNRLDSSYCVRERGKPFTRENLCFHVFFSVLFFFFEKIDCITVDEDELHDFFFPQCLRPPVFGEAFALSTFFPPALFFCLSDALVISFCKKKKTTTIQSSTSPLFTISSSTLLFFFFYNTPQPTHVSCGQHTHKKLNTMG